MKPALLVLACALGLGTWTWLVAHFSTAPQPGRYQLIIHSGHAIVWDTAKAQIVKYDGNTIEHLRLDFQPDPAK